METKQTTSKGRLIRRLHALRSQAGLTQADYEALLDSYGVESSRDLTEEQLEALCRFLQGQLGGSHAKADECRKRLLAAVCRFCADIVGGWEEREATSRIEYAKTVACRAAGLSRWDSHGRDQFNRLSVERMRSLTYAFQKRKRDLDGVVEAALALVNGKEVRQ